ncbi:MAG: OsmC family protein [Chitinophagaceae bacterium]|nr:OsmC family protein [Chitinophagaceae bacterium]
MTALIEYTGNLRCTAKHVQSGTMIETDAPTDNHGKGERFSPTDTLSMALATCMLTTMGIKIASMEDISIDGATAEVTKHMASNPRRVAAIDVVVNLPEQKDEKTREILMNIGNNCPVAKSLHPDIQLNIQYNWVKS